VILPERNRADLEDVPADVRSELRFHPVETVDQVLRLALAPAADALAA
jgi:ATP-dependent Lon protease